MTDYTLTSGAGTFTLTGLHAGPMVAVPGEFALAGQAAVLAVGYKLVAGTGEFTLNPIGADFGSFVSSTPSAKLSYKESSGAFITTSGATVEIDILEGAAFQHSVESQYDVTRVAVVRGLNPDSDMDTGELMLAAVDAVIEVTGGLGSRLASIPYPNYIQRFVPELMKGEKDAKVSIIYRCYPLPQYDFDAASGQIETNVDRDDTAIEVAYTYPDDYQLDSRKAGRTIIQGGLVQAPQRESTVTVRFVITAGYLPALVIDGAAYTIYGYVGATSIMTMLMRLQGRLISGTFTLNNLTGGDRCWLIERVSGQSKDGGRTYSAAITLHLRPQGWDPTVTFINPDDGKPPPDLVDGIGYYKPEILGECAAPTWLFGNPNYWTQGEDWTWL